MDLERGLDGLAAGGERVRLALELLRAVFAGDARAAELVELGLDLALLRAKLREFVQPGRLRRFCSSKLLHELVHPSAVGGPEAGLFALALLGLAAGHGAGGLEEL